jgi:hypothetical protein
MHRRALSVAAATEKARGKKIGVVKRVGPDWEPGRRRLEDCAKQAVGRARRGYQYGHVHRQDPGASQGHRRGHLGGMKR